MASFTPCYQICNTLLTQRTAENSIMYSPVKFINWQCNSIYTFFLTYWAKNVLEAKTWCQVSKKIIHIKLLMLNFEHKWKENEHHDNTAIQECKHKHHKLVGHLAYV